MQVMKAGVCVDLGMKQVREEGMCRSGVKQVRGRVCVDRV